MKKSYELIGIIILIILVIGIFQFISKEEISEESVNLELNKYISNIESCIGNEECVDGSVPPTKEFDKLKLIQDLNGIIICTQEFGDSNSGCSLSSRVSEPCDNIWSLTFITMGTRSYDTLISIDKCGDNYYILEDLEGPGPNKISLAKVQLDEEIIKNLKK